MLKYILQRIGLMIITFLIIIIIVFVVIRLMPDYDVPSLDRPLEQILLQREKEGRDRPIPEQFVLWVRNIIRDGEFGYSYIRNRDAIEVLGARIPVTFRINVVPFLISTPLGFALGIFAALKKNKIPDQIISLAVIFFISVPMFVIASLLQYYLGYRWGILEPTYFTQIDGGDDFILRLRSVLLPYISLTLGTVAGFTRFTRAELTEVLTSEFMLLCRTKGLTRRQATLRHALRNSLVPLAPMVIGGFVALLSGSLIIERIFRIPGIGGIYLEAFQNRDYALVMVLVGFYLIIGLTTTLVVDVSYSIVDPRIRLGGGKRA